MRPDNAGAVLGQNHALAGDGNLLRAIVHQHQMDMIAEEIVKADLFYAAGDPRVPAFDGLAVIAARGEAQLLQSIMHRRVIAVGRRM